MRIRSVPVVIALVGVIALAGCSSSTTAKGDGGSTSAPPGSSKPGSSGAPAASGPADAATTKSVTTAYQVFFGSTSTSAQSQAVLQNGASFTKALAEQAKSSYAQKSAATVSKVVLAGTDVADVTFTITTNGSALLKNTSGKAVRENGTWKVAAATFCGLLGLQGTPPSACNNPKITALPD